MTTITQPSAWKPAQLFALRFAICYFIIQAVPLDWKFYQALFHVRAGHYEDWLRLTAYYPTFLSGSNTPLWGIASYINWAVAAGLALIGAFLWQFKVLDVLPADRYYYLLRVLLRYRLAVGVLGYGLLKLIWVQLPRPALSDLYTAYGDFLPWKVYYHTTGVGKAYYEQTIGVLEIIGAVLLLFRKTVVFGAFLLTLLLTNILMANFAYSLGHHLYSSYLLVLALVLLSHDLPNIVNIVSFNRKTSPARSRLVFSGNFLRIRKGLQIALVAFFIFLGSLIFISFKHSDIPYPSTPGLKDAYGYYNVKSFIYNGITLPYSPVDSLRWQNVVFEKWNTLSVKINQPVKINLSIPALEGEANYETLGNGGRHYYRYSADSVHSSLLLRSIEDPSCFWRLASKRPDNETILLFGTNEQQDTVSIVLERQHHRFLLEEGRRNIQQKF